MRSEVRKVYSTCKSRSNIPMVNLLFRRMYNDSVRALRQLTAVTWFGSQSRITLVARSTSLWDAALGSATAANSVERARRKHESSSGFGMPIAGGVQAASC